MALQPANNDARILVRLLFFPSERLVGSVARLVSDFTRTVLDDAQASSRFHLAAYELVENLVKYSTGDSATIEVELEEQNETISMFTIRARNRATPERLAEVQKRLGALRAAEDPVEFYDQLVIEAAPRSKGSGLGLARIRAETDIDLDFTIEGDELTIVARAPIERKETA